MAAKLTYFNMTGLGEPIRLLLAAANIEFEDKRIDKEEWEELKPTLKWPHLPMLEIDGKVLFQSRAIARYIAHKSGLTGSDGLEAAFADMTVATLGDMRLQVVRHYYEPDSPQRTDALAEALRDAIPFYLEKFEEQAKENNGYLVGGKLTWADVVLFCYSDYIGYLLSTDLLAGYPTLKDIVEKVNELPGVSQYLASRPEPPADLRTFFF